MPIPMWVYQTFMPHIMLLLLGSWLPRTHILLELLLSPKSQWTSSQAESIHTAMLWDTGKGEDDSATLSSFLLWQISGLFEPSLLWQKNQKGWTSQSFAMLFGEAKSLHKSKIQVWQMNYLLIRSPFPLQIKVHQKTGSCLRKKDTAGTPPSYTHLWEQM